MIDLDYQQVNTCQYFAEQTLLADMRHKNLYTLLDYIINNINTVVDKYSETRMELEKKFLDSLIPFKYNDENDELQIDYNFAVIASDIEFGEISNKMSKTIPLSHLVFKVLLEIAYKYYDVIIIDTPPGVDFLPSQFALMSVENLLTVTDVGEFGLTGLNKMIATFKSSSLINKNLNFVGVVINKVKQNSYDNDFVAFVKESYGDYIIDTVLNDYVDYKQALLERKYILTDYKQVRGQKSIENAKKLLNEIDSRVKWIRWDGDEKR